MNDRRHFDNHPEDRPRRRHGWGSVLLGLAVLATGLLLTLDNFDVIDASEYFHLWPILVILAGVSRIARPAPSRCLLSGLIWIGIGAVLLLDNLGFIAFDIWDLWPLLLVFAGLSILSRGFRRGRRGVTTDPSATFSATALMGGDTRRITAENFQGGEATAIMGGCEIDLRGAGSEGGPAEIDCFALWGGIEIWVPEDWEVQTRVAAILAGSEDKTHGSPPSGAKVLIVRGMAIMAGIEIKN